MEAPEARVWSRGRNPAPQVASGVGECPSGQPDSGFLGPRPSPVPLPHLPAKAFLRAIPRTEHRIGWPQVWLPCLSLPSWLPSSRGWGLLFAKEASGPGLVEPRRTRSPQTLPACLAGSCPLLASAPPSFPKAESRGGPGPLQLLPLTLSLGAAARLPWSHLPPNPTPSPSAPGANKGLFFSLYLRHMPRTRPCGFPLARQPRAGWLGAGLETGAGSPGSGSFRGSGLGTSAARCASGSASPGRGARDRWDGSEAGRPSESAESRLFPARRLPPVLLPCGHAPRCPLTVWPLPPSTATAPGTPL